MFLLMQLPGCVVDMAAIHVQMQQSLCLFLGRTAVASSKVTLLPLQIMGSLKLPYGRKNCRELCLADSVKNGIFKDLMVGGLLKHTHTHTPKLVDFNLVVRLVIRQIRFSAKFSSYTS